VGARRAWFLGTAQRCPLEGSRGLRGLRGGGQTPDDTVSPCPQVGLELVPVHVPQDGRERSGTGGGMGEAESLRDACAIMASPVGDGTITASTTEPRTTRQREDGRSRMPCATRLPNVGDRRAYCNARTWMCSHQTPPLERGVAQVWEAEQATPHLEHHPLSPLGVCHAIPLRKLNGPGTR
jgi:hypothetical protein